jgi:hypothetical protein
MELRQRPPIYSTTSNRLEALEELKIATTIRSANAHVKALHIYKVNWYKTKKLM